VSAREIMQQLPRLTSAELQAIEQRAAELISRASNGRSLHPERIDGRLVLTGPGILRQADVDAILNEFP
jgi:hypothetical protein